MIFWYVYIIVMILIWVFGGIIASSEGPSDTFLMMILIGATWLPLLVFGTFVFVGQVIQNKIYKGK